MISGEEYRKRIGKLKSNVYMGGKEVDRFDPRLIGGPNVMAATYDFASDPEFEGLGVAVSHLTGEKVNRFTHINRGMEDLLQKQKMTRLFSQEVGGCIQRCMGIDALHGRGSPVIEKVAIYRDANIEHSKSIAKKLAGIPYQGSTKTMPRKSILPK